MVRHFDGSAEVKIRYDLFRALKCYSTAVNKVRRRRNESDLNRVLIKAPIGQV